MVLVVKEMALATLESPRPRPLSHCLQLRCHQPLYLQQLCHQPLYLQLRCHQPLYLQQRCHQRLGQSQARRLSPQRLLLLNRLRHPSRLWPRRRPQQQRRRLLFHRRRRCRRCCLIVVAMGTNRTMAAVDWQLSVWLSSLRLVAELGSSTNAETTATAERCSPVEPLAGGETRDPQICDRDCGDRGRNSGRIIL